MPVRAHRLTPVLLALTLLLAACSAASGGSSPATPAGPGALPRVLRVGLIPNVAPETQRARYAPFGEDLGRRLGVPVELFVASTYAGVVTALAAGQLDLAYLGGLTYVQADRQVPLTPLVTEVDRETGTRRYLSSVVVPSGSAARTVADVVAAGGSFAFGDPSSTSGSLYPRLMLDDAGARCSTTTLDRCPPLASTRFTGGHDATALAVANGRADAGGLELRVLHRLETQGVVPPGGLRVVGSREAMGYPWVARTALGPAAVESLRAAFLDLRDPVLLDLLRAERYESVQPSDYDEIRREAARLGLLS